MNYGSEYVEKQMRIFEPTKRGKEWGITLRTWRGTKSEEIGIRSAQMNWIWGGEGGAAAVCVLEGEGEGEGERSGELESGAGWPFYLSASTTPLSGALYCRGITPPMEALWCHPRGPGVDLCPGHNAYNARRCSLDHNASKAGVIEKG